MEAHTEYLVWAVALLASALVLLGSAVQSYVHNFGPRKGTSWPHRGISPLT
jgi:hypothetical protein